MDDKRYLVCGRSVWRALFAGGLLLLGAATSAGCIRVVTQDAAPATQTPLATRAAIPQSSPAPQNQTSASAASSLLVGANPTATIQLPAPRPTAPVPTAPSPTAQPSAPSNLPKDVALFVGSWEIYSERLYYDAGGASNAGIGGAHGLQLSADGGWEFGGSSGRWSVSPIAAEDWKRWGVASYGPTRKITLAGWSGSGADGPIEEEPGRIDFLWAIYHAGRPTVQDPGTMFVKFGHP